MWSRDGKELFYRNGNRLMAVSITNRPSFSADEPQLLFEADYYREGVFIPGGPDDYDVGPDGRFLMIKKPELAPHLVVVVGWTEELNRLVPTEN
jgi:hypothetical protein